MRAAVETLLDQTPAADCEEGETQRQCTWSQRGQRGGRTVSCMACTGCTSSVECWKLECPSRRVLAGAVVSGMVLPCVGETPGVCSVSRRVGSRRQAAALACQHSRKKLPWWMLCEGVGGEGVLCAPPAAVLAWCRCETPGAQGSA